MGQYPLTLFILVAATLVYLHVSRQKAQQGASGAAPAPSDGTVTIPPAPAGKGTLEIPIPGHGSFKGILIPGQTPAERYYDEHGDLRGFKG